MLVLWRFVPYTKHTYILLGENGLELSLMVSHQCYSKMTLNEITLFEELFYRLLKKLMKDGAIKSLETALEALFVERQHSVVETIEYGVSYS